jgi:curli biogenesis system outer membrane secretion channel CsgG
MKKIILDLIFSFNLNLFSQANKANNETQDNKKIISDIVDELYSNLSGKCTRLVVFDPEYSDGRISEAGKILNERFITYFAKKRNISIIERSKLYKIYEEQKIQKSGLIDDKTSIEIGKILGADCIFTASLNDLKEKRVEINSRIIKMETGEILATSISELEKEWTDRKIVEGEKVVQKITFEPTPLKKVEIEEAKQIKTIDFTDTDIEVLKEYDKLYQMDLDDNISPLDKSRLWYEFGNKYSKYSDIAKERGDYWIEYDKNKSMRNIKRKRKKRLIRTGLN